VPSAFWETAGAATSDADPCHTSTHNPYPILTCAQHCIALYATASVAPAAHHNHLRRPFLTRHSSHAPAVRPSSSCRGSPECAATRLPQHIIAWAPTHGMKISSPQGLRYPYTIQALQKRKDEKVARSDKLFTYWYEELVTETDRWGVEQKVKKRWPQQFDASTEGKVTRWFIKPGTVIERAG
jgi:hypothetical protein